MLNRVIELTMHNSNNWGCLSYENKGRMAMYERRSRLTTRQQSELIRFFVAGATARAAGELVGAPRNGNFVFHAPTTSDFHEFAQLSFIWRG